MAYLFVATTVSIKYIMKVEIYLYNPVEIKGDSEELKAIVKGHPSQTISKMAAGFTVSYKTVLIHLRQIGKIKNLERWVPHD